VEKEANDEDMNRRGSRVVRRGRYVNGTPEPGLEPGWLDPLVMATMKEKNDD
jgi:hypothetical protein